MPSQSTFCTSCKHYLSVDAFSVNRIGVPYKTCNACKDRRRENRRDLILQPTDANARRTRTRQHTLNGRPSSTRRRIADDERPLAPVPPAPQPAPAAFISQLASTQRHDLGPMNVLCEHCSAYHFIDERRAGTTAAQAQFENCCKQGHVRMAAPPPPPPYLHDLLTASSPLARHFRQNIRQYNSMFAFTSVNYTQDDRLPDRGGLRSFSIQGELYHLHGQLLTDTNQSPRFAQLFFFDPLEAAICRHQNAPSLDRTILLLLTELLHAINPLIRIYKTAHERLQTERLNAEEMRLILNPQMRLIIEHGADRRRENLPTSDEMAIIIPDEYGEACFRDLVLSCRSPHGGSSFKRVLWGT